jgi:hypothetical protein
VRRAAGRGRSRRGRSNRPLIVQRIATRSNHAARDATVNAARKTPHVGGEPPQNTTGILNFAVRDRRILNSVHNAAFHRQRAAGRGAAWSAQPAWLLAAHVKLRVHAVHRQRTQGRACPPRHAKKRGIHRTDALVHAHESASRHTRTRALKRLPERARVCVRILWALSAPSLSVGSASGITPTIGATYSPNAGLRRTEHADGSMPTGACRPEHADRSMPTGARRPEHADGAPAVELRQVLRAARERLLVQLVVGRAQERCEISGLPGGLAAAAKPPTAGGGRARWGLLERPAL